MRQFLLQSWPKFAHQAPLCYGRFNTLLSWIVDLIYNTFCYTGNAQSSRRKINYKLLCRNICAYLDWTSQLLRHFARYFANFQYVREAILHSHRMFLLEFGILTQVFQDNKRRLLALKGALGVSAYSYRNLAWRLEVEVRYLTSFSHFVNELKYSQRFVHLYTLRSCPSAP